MPSSLPGLYPSHPSDSHTQQLLFQVPDTQLDPSVSAELPTCKRVEMKDFSLLLLPVPSPCIRDRLVGSPAHPYLHTPKTLFPEHKLTGPCWKLMVGEGQLVLPCSDGMQALPGSGSCLSLPCCPCPATWLPEVWARCDIPVSPLQ